MVLADLIGELVDEVLQDLGILKYRLLGFRASGLGRIWG